MEHQNSEFMCENLNVVEVSNLSPNATERDLYDFFSFSGGIEHIEIIRSGDYGSTGYVTFKEPHALETALLLSGATIIDQQVCIARWGYEEESSSFWPSWRVDDSNETEIHGDYFTTTPREAMNFAQEVVTAMLAKGYTLGTDAFHKAKAFDESYHFSATAATKVADMSKRIGLTDQINAVRSIDEKYHFSETAKNVVSAISSSVVNSSYFSAGALLLSDALKRAADAAADLGKRGAQN